MTTFNLSRFNAILFDLDSTLTDTNGYAIRASAWILSQCTSEPDDILEPYLMTLVRHYRKETYRIADGYPYISPHECVKNAIQSTIDGRRVIGDFASGQATLGSARPSHESCERKNNDYGQSDEQTGGGTSAYLPQLDKPEVVVCRACCKD